MRGAAPDNFFKNRLTPTNYESLKRECFGDHNSFEISEKYFRFAILWAILRKWEDLDPFLEVRKNFKPLESGPVIYHFE